MEKEAKVVEDKKFSLEDVKALIAEERERLKEEFQSKAQREMKKSWKDVQTRYRIYRLKEDVFFDKKFKDGTVKKMKSYEKGAEFKQNHQGTLCLGFKSTGMGIEIGDPKYFEYVRDEVVTNSQYKAQFEF